MENFEVRPKSFTIKWIHIPDNSTVQWEIKPSKRSINLGIYRYNKNDLSTNNTHHPTQQHPHSSNSLYSSSRNSSAPNSSSTTTSENLSLDEVNAVPHKMFNALHQNMRDSFDSVNSSGINHGAESNSVLGSSLNMSSNTMNGFSSTEPRKRGDSVSSLKSSNSENIPSLLEDKMDKHLTKELVPSFLK